jgi:hypothetical protein
MDKTKIIAHIERGTDGTYGVYFDAEKYNLDYLCIGDGETVEAAVKDFYGSYEEMKTCFAGENRYFQEADFRFEYDMASFLDFYTSYFSLVGLSRLTGVAKGQLSHYVTGRRKPSRRTISKIDNSVHNFAKKFNRVAFIF